MKVRIISALLMAIAVILGLFLLPATIFNILALLLFLVGLTEWRRLCHADARQTAIHALVMFALYLAYTTAMFSSVGLLLIFAVGLLLWLYRTLQLGTPATVGGGLCLVNGTASLALAWLAMVSLRDDFGTHQLLLAMLMVWSADTFAYFGGKYMGSTKLAPAISPGKTREGVVTGVLMAMLVSVIYSHVFIAPLSSFTQMFVLLFVSVLVALISVVGDLSISKLKRAAGLKDSGHLIPGHGGVLDRIDGLMAGLVVYAFYAYLTSTLQ